MNLKMTGFSKEGFNALSNKIIEDSKKVNRNMKFWIFNKDIWEKCIDAVIHDLKEINRKENKLQ
jgi:hypothetical protein